MFWEDLRIELGNELVVTVWKGDTNVGVALVPMLFQEGGAKRAFINLLKHGVVDTKARIEKHIFNKRMKSAFPNIFGVFCTSKIDNNNKIILMPDTEQVTFDQNTCEMRIDYDKIFFTYENGDYGFFIPKQWLVKKARNNEKLLNEWIYTGKYDYKTPHNILKGLNKRIKEYSGRAENAFGSSKDGDILLADWVTITEQLKN